MTRKIFSQLDKQLINLVIFIGVIAVGLGALYHHKTQQSVEASMQEVNATVLSTARPISPFTLSYDHGKAFTNENLQKHWTFVFFGFTRCPGICPTTMAQLSKMYDQLNHDNVSQLPQVVMITVDPDRDDNNALAQYTSAFNKNFIGAVPSKDQLKKMTQELGVAYLKQQTGKDPQNYVMDHNGTVLLFNPQGEVQAFFSEPHDGLSMAKDFEIISKKISG